MPLSVAQVDVIAQQFIAEYNGNIPLVIRTRENQEDIYGPQNAERISGIRIEGGYHPAIGTVALVASRFHNEKQVSRTLQHEILGHYGLNTFTPDQKRDLLYRVLETRQESSLAPIWKKVDRHYPELSELKKAEEVFAFVAEDQRSFMQRSWDKVRASLQKALRATGLSNRPLTLPELRQQALAIAHGIRAGRRQQQTFPTNDHAQFKKDVTVAKNSKPTYAEQVANQIIEQLRQGTAPWARPWKPNEYQLPHNPHTGAVYKGVNHLNLACKPHSDPRWMTYKQAAAAGYQVKKGSKATTVQYWKFHEKRAKRDADGKEVKDEQGNTVMVNYKLERPKTFYAKVFNAEQIEGIPPLPPREPLAWNPHERAESILSNSGADIRHDQADGAYYSPVSDRIHLPEREQFATAGNYYATALHELGHWTGHASRLDRDMSHPFGSSGYAKEELRAEIASFMFNTELGLGHDPGQHVAYVGSWIKALEEDPLEIFRAASDAEKIKTYVLDLTRTQNLEQEQEVFQANTQRTSSEEAKKMSPRNVAIENTPLAIPYHERNEAKRLAGKLPNGENALGWDKENKTWYAKPGANLDALKAYLLENVAERQAPAKSAQEELAETLKANGFQLNDSPIIDGKWHRVPVDDDGRGQTSGAYRVFGDGRPAGHYQNHRLHDEPVKWVASGQRLSDEERAKLQAEAATKKAQRQALQAQKYDHHAKRCQQLWDQLRPAAGNQYLVRKGVKNYDVRMDKKGRLVVPLRNAQGQIRSLQRIGSNGFKSLKKGAEKQGNYHLLNGDKLATSKAYFIAEGYATAASIAEATNMPVVAAIDAGNLPAVAQQFHHQYHDKGVVIAGDDDRFNEKGNKGRRKAEEAVSLVGDGARLVLPRFGNNPERATDFNDLHQQNGLDALKNQLRPAVQSLVEQQKIRVEQKPNVQKTNSEKQAVRKSR
ncbi:zincin-like metallopeptidase domain-containing protein [Microbulbifer sp. 2201CG32-9]|uniref:zincin-like metallopeptidase domain-containing protein n=1 Tax=Microbulbifer sp. 2201CG32-9 TaxID=3232309 RepID=UPI00345C2B28